MTKDTKKSTEINIKIKNNSIIEALPLVTQRARDGKIYIGNKATKSFLVIDSYWTPLVDILKTPQTVEEIARKLKRIDDECFSEDEVMAKIKILLLFFSKYHLLHRIDNHIFHHHLKVAGVYFPKLTPKLIKLIFNPIPIAVIIGFGIVALTSPFINHNFIPKPIDFFWHPRLSIALLTYFLISWIMVYFHEFAHFATARFFGAKGGFRFSHRLYFLVVETWFPDIYALHEYKRIAIFMSGIITDLAIVGISYLLLTYQHFFPFLSPLFFIFIRQIVLLQWLTILWQFYFFMQTDLYYVIKDLLHIGNLYSLSLEKVKSWIFGSPFTPKLKKRDSIIVSIYAVFFICGTITAFIRYGFYHLPITFWLFQKSIFDIANGIKTNDLVTTCDGIVVFTLETFFFLLLLSTFDYHSIKTRIFKFLRLKSPQPILLTNKT